MLTWIELASCLAVSSRLVTHIARLQTLYWENDNDGDGDDGDDDDHDDDDDDYQEKSDGLPPRLGSSLCTRPGCSTACIEEESRLKKRLDKHCQGGEQLEKVELGVGGEEAGKTD